MTNTDATATHAFALPPVPSRRTQGLEEGLPAALYAGDATALRDFLLPLGLTAFKFGLSGRRYVNARILDLRARRYASIVADLANRDATLSSTPSDENGFCRHCPDPAADAEATAWLAKLPHGEFRGGVIKFPRSPRNPTCEPGKAFQSPLMSETSTYTSVRRRKEASWPKLAFQKP